MRGDTDTAELVGTVLGWVLVVAIFAAVVWLVAAII